MKTKKLVMAALMAALTYVATTVIKIETPTMGYIHPGDAFVILSGVFLGPLTGGLAAGIGSMLSDLLSGYLLYAPATFVIKALTAVIAGNITFFLSSKLKKARFSLPLFIGGLVGEAFMVLSYFVFEIFLMAFTSSKAFNASSLAAGFASSVTGIPFNILQGVFGIAIASMLYPVLHPLVLRLFHEN